MITPTLQPQMNVVSLHHRLDRAFLEKELPSNLEAERAVLGANLLDNSVCKQMIELLKRDDFFLDAHRKLYDKMIALYERGSSIDLLTIGEELRRAGEFEQIGGATYISSLIDGVPRTDNIAPYANILKEKTALRKLITSTYHATTRALDGEYSAATIYADTVNQFDEIYRHYLTDGSSQKKLYSVEELAALPPVEWLKEGHIARGAFTLLFGQSGSLKSFYTLDLMLHLSTLGYSTVYVVGEGQSGIWKRVNAWRTHHKTRPGPIHFWLDAVNLLNRSEVSGFIKSVARLKPDIVVFDTLSRCMAGGDENAATDMTAFVDACGRIQGEFRAAVWVVHHPPRGQNRERGHSSLRGAADVIIEVVNEGTVTIRCEKSKDDEPFETYYLRPIKIITGQKDNGEDEDSLVLLPADKVIESPDHINLQERRILETLLLEVFEKTGARYAQLRNSSGVPEGSIYRVLASLKRKGLINQSENGEPYYISDAGRKVIEPSSPS